jgi:hypothetical protein
VPLTAVLDMPARHVQLWLAWLVLEWDRPSRGDYYQMATRAAVYQANSKNAGQFTVNRMRLDFGTRRQAPPALSPEEATRRAKARMAARRGMSVEEVEAMQAARRKG